MAESIKRIKQSAQDAFDRAGIDYEVSRVKVVTSWWRRDISWVPRPYVVSLGRNVAQKLDLTDITYARHVAHEFMHTYQIERAGLGSASWLTWWRYYWPRRDRLKPPGLEWEADSFAAQYAWRLPK